MLVGFVYTRSTRSGARVLHRLLGDSLKGARPPDCGARVRGLVFGQSNVKAALPKQECCPFLSPINPEGGHAGG